MNNRNLASLYLPFGGCLAAGMAAALLATHEPEFGLFGLLALGVACAIVWRPELGALAILVLVVIVPRSYLFDRGIPVGNGNIKVTDVLLLLTLGSWLVHLAMAGGDGGRRPRAAVTGLLLAFVGITVLGVATAAVRGSSLKFALLELRPLLSFLLIFPLVERARTMRDVERFASAVLGAFGIASLVAIWQYLHGKGSQATYTDDAIRVIGWSVFSLLGLVWSLVLLSSERPRWKGPLVGLAVLSIAGEYVSFQRATWVATVVALAGVVVVARSSSRRRLLGWIGLILMVGAVTIVLVNADSTKRIHAPLGALTSRFGSVLAYRSDVSAGRRLAEWNAATVQIERHPLTGIGLGSTITFYDPEFSTESNTYGFVTTQYYIHDSYLWFALKLGFPGLIALLLLLVTVAGDSFRAYTANHRTGWPATYTLAGLGCLAVLVVASVGGPEFNDDNSAPIAAGTLALLIITRRLGSFDRSEREAIRD